MHQRHLLLRYRHFAVSTRNEKGLTDAECPAYGEETMRKESLSGTSLQETVVCYTNDTWSSALSEIRLKTPLEAAGFQVAQGNDCQNLLIKDLARVNYVVVQRDFPRYIDHFFNILRQTREHKIPLIYEIDDLLFDLPYDHPDYQNGSFLDGLVPMLIVLSKADLVTVSTEPIADFLRPFNPNIHVLQNYLADSIWNIKQPHQTESSKTEVVIGYIGSHTHLPDLNKITQALISILNQYGSRITLKFFGGKPPEELSTYSHIEWYPTIGSYREFSASLINENIDILIAPLTPSLFNQCKSPLKFFEYSAMGCPAIYSRGLPYNNVIRHGENGFLADSIDDWIHYLRALIESPALRFQIAEKAQDTIKKGWLLSGHAQDWANTYHASARAQQIIPDDIMRQELVWKKVLQAQTHQRREQIATRAMQEKVAELAEAVRLLGEKDKYMAEAVHLLEEKDKSLAEIKRNFISYTLKRLLNKIRLGKGGRTKG
jgi:glycosyltransferase involved in cell wall biosynthesis